MNKPHRALALLVLLSACESTTAPKVRNNDPVPLILSPGDGEALVEGAPLALLGSCGDTNHQPTLLTAVWRSGEEILCEEAPVGEDGLSRCEAVARVGMTSVSLSVRDPAGGSGQTMVSLELAPNTPPRVEILTPSAGERRPAGAYTVVEAALADAEEPATALSLAWTDTDGTPLALDTEIDSNGGLSGAILLPPGAHTLTLTATDTLGASASASVSIEVIEEE